MDRSSIIEALCMENDDFKKIYDKHQIYEKELEDLQNLRFMTPEENVKAKDLKKNKLLLKDRMESFITGYKKIS